MRRHGPERGVAAMDDVGFHFATPFERVFDQSGDVVFVFNNQDTVFGHRMGSATLPARRFAPVSESLNLGYMTDAVDAILEIGTFMTRRGAIGIVAGALALT